MKEEKQLSLFWTIRKQIATVRNQEESVLAANVFHKAVAEGLITREEEEILEAFLVLHAVQHINEKKPSTTLPVGSNSWFALWKGIRVPERVKQVEISNPSPISYSNEFEEVESNLFDVDYIKARAFEEIVKFAPENTTQAGNIAFGYRTGQHMTGGANDKEVSLLFDQYEFYAKNDIDQ